MADASVLERLVEKHPNANLLFLRCEVTARRMIAMWRTWAVLRLTFEAAALITAIISIGFPLWTYWDERDQRFQSTIGAIWDRLDSARGVIGNRGQYEGIRFLAEGNLLEGGDLSDLLLVDVDLSGRNLDSVDFSEASLGGANLSGSSLRNAKFVSAHMIRMSMQHAVMYGVVKPPSYVPVLDRVSGTGGRIFNA